MRSETRQETRSIDVTGLPQEAIEAVESLVGFLRDKDTERPARQHSVFDLFGKAPVLRSAHEIAEQLRGERDAWPES
jgi:hypothetical protein